MGVLVDVLILGFLVFIPIYYYRKGLLSSILGFGRFIISVISASFLGKYLADYLADGYIGNTLTHSVYNKITSFVDGKALSDFFNSVPRGFLRLVELFGADIEKLEEKYSTAQSSDEVLREMAEGIAMPVAETVSSILAALVVFFVTYIAVTVVIFLLKHVKIPIITSFDRLLGLGLGIIVGILGVSLASTVLYSLLEFLSASRNDAEIMNVYNNSWVFKLICNLRIFEFIRKLI